MSKAELVSYAEFARRIKLSKAMINKAKRQGVFKGATVDIPGKAYPLLQYKRAVRFYNARMDPNFRKERQTPQKKKKAKGGNGKPSKAKGGEAGGQTFVSARAEVEQYKARDLRLKYEINEGLWLKKSVVIDQAFKASRLMRDNLLNIPSRIAALLAAESEQNRCYKIIHDEIKDVLDDFERQIKKIAKSNKPKGG